MDLMDRPPGAHGEWSESRNGSGPNSPDIYDRPGLPHPHPLFHPAALHHLRPPHPAGSPPNPNQTATGNTNSNSISKPRIWSLADMASKESKDEPSNLSANAGNPYHSPGKILSPLAARGLHPLHHPYMRPELYRNFYNPAHLAGNPHEAAIFESYQRTFGASLAHNGVPLSSVLSKGPPFGPLSLTTSSPSHNTPTAPPPRASPASSTSSTHEHNTPEKSLPTTPVTPIAINVTKP